MKRDIKKKDAIKAFNALGYYITKEDSHIKLENGKGNKVWGLPNHRLIKGSTLSEVLRRAEIDRNKFFNLC